MSKITIKDTTLSLYVNNIEESKKFYKSVLFFEDTAVSNQLSHPQFRQFSIAFFKVDEILLKDEVIISFEIDDIDSFVRYYKKHVGSFHKIASPPYGSFYYLKDPNGYLICLYELLINQNP